MDRPGFLYDRRILQKTGFRSHTFPSPIIEIYSSSARICTHLFEHDVAGSEPLEIAKKKAKGFVLFRIRFINKIDPMKRSRPREDNALTPTNLIVACPVF